MIRKRNQILGFSIVTFISGIVIGILILYWQSV